MLAFSSEEKHSYLVSIDNLIALKMLHTFGIDVSTFSNFMTDISYGVDTSTEILHESIENLFDTAVVFNPYEDEDDDTTDSEGTILKNILIEMGFELNAEFYYICSSVKLQALVKNPFYKEEIEAFFDPKSDSEFHFELNEGETKLGETGQIGMSFEFVGQLSETIETIIHFLERIDKLYQEMVGEQL